MCQFHAGSATNVIPQTAELNGSCRYFDEETRDMVHDRVCEIVENTGKTFRCNATVRFEYGYIPTINTVSKSEVVKNLAISEFGDEFFSTD